MILFFNIFVSDIVSKSIIYEILAIVGFDNLMSVINFSI
jgi:hypothetical protein